MFIAAAPGTVAYCCALFWPRARRVSFPQIFDDPSERDHSIRVEHEHREDRALLRLAEREGTVVVADLQRSEHPESHGGKSRSRSRPSRLVASAGGPRPKPGAHTPRPIADSSLLEHEREQDEAKRTFSRCARQSRSTHSGSASTGRR